jgi:hypothetical protein
VVGFESRTDAERFLAEFGERVAKFGLELHADKTRLIEFGRNAARNRKQRGEGKPETFTFLGFTHYCGNAGATGHLSWGGEPHTFTEVAQFGGGFIPDLNGPGETTIPECNNGFANNAVAKTRLLQGSTLQGCGPFEGPTPLSVLHPSLDARHGGREIALRQK